MADSPPMQQAAVSRHAWLLRTHAENRFDESRKPQIRRMLGSNNTASLSLLPCS
eukprot:COSAG05_NODE_23960_length_254_cov_1.341935_1_plen_53_part_10